MKNQKTNPLLEELLAHIKGSDDEHPDSILDEVYTRLVKDYQLTEEIDWEDEDKYQYATFLYKVTLADDSVHYISMDVSRSGSYYSDYYYSLDNVNVVPKFEGSQEIVISIKGINPELVNHIEEALESALGSDCGEVSHKVNTYEGWV